MPSLTVSLRVVLAALLLPACGEPCARLSKALCDGGEQDYCVKVDEWLATRLIDPDTKEPLQGQPRDQVCTAIYGSVDIFNAYRFKAKQKLLGEPDFTMASSTPAANRADPDPVPAKPAITTPVSKTDLPAGVKMPDEAKAAEPRPEEPRPEDAKADEDARPEEHKPDDGEEDKPGANMSD